MDNKTNTTPEENIIDLDLSVTAKKRVRINGDQNRILRINPSDMGIAKRLGEVYNKLNELTEKAANMADVDTSSDDIDKQLDSVKEFGAKLDAIDKEMRELMDYLFDTNVSEVCAPDGTMYDICDGMFRYEHIIEKVATLYENNFESEFKKMKSRVNKRTAKYTGKKKS